MRRPRSRITAPGGLNYSKHYNRQLRKMLQDRTHQKVSKYKTKAELVNMLAQLDLKPVTFNFMGLPPELRDCIYEFVLHSGVRRYGRNRGRTAILRTSKQMYKEASAVLYSIPLTISLLACKDPFSIRDLVQTTIVLLRHQHRRRITRDDGAQLASIPSNWPKQVLKFRHVKVSVRMKWNRKPMLVIVNHALFGIGSTLLGNGNLKRVHVKLVVEGEAQISDEELYETLWPISLLRRKPELRITLATPSDSTKQYFLRQQAPTSDLKVHPIAHINSLLKRTEDVMALLNLDAWNTEVQHIKRRVLARRSDLTSILGNSEMVAEEYLLWVAHVVQDTENMLVDSRHAEVLSRLRKLREGRRAGRLGQKPKRHAP